MSTFQIKHCATGQTLFQCELDPALDDAGHGVRLGAAVISAVKNGANLHGANLCNANLCGANLCGAKLDNWIPKLTNVHQSVLAAATCHDNALDMGIWHSSCGTTHCRAGWVVTLVGDGGRVLEGVMGTPTAAALIYMASDPSLERVPDFHCDNAEALADMARLAEIEKSKGGAA